MKRTAPIWIIVAVIGLVAPAGAADVQSDGFDEDEAGAPPIGWNCGVTGSGAARWIVEADPTAPSKPNVLKQSGQGEFPWCTRKNVAIADGFAEVKFKPERGASDRAGGLVWRFKDGENFYVARANALENNVSLYYTERGRRHTLRSVDAPVAANAWHSLRVEFAGTRIKVFLDGKQYIEVDDDRISGPGSVGVWTKEDSVTAFDDFVWGGN